MADAIKSRRAGGEIYSNFIEATGGTITYSGNYKIHTFISSGTFTVTARPELNSNVEYLIVGGGGGGGQNSSGLWGGGGGGGGVNSGTYNVFVNSYPVTIGAGGGTYTSGNMSKFGEIIGYGGGRGGFQMNDQNTGGSGGGAGGGSDFDLNDTSFGGGAIPGQGNDGGNYFEWDVRVIQQNQFGYANLNRGAGGGGGAGAIGGNPLGGSGINSSISGSSITYAGGGGGGAWNSGIGTGGAGGGGTGLSANSTFNNFGQMVFVVSAFASSGSPNTGGGGGGFQPVTGSGISNNGGSGIVIIRYIYQ
jgi:hypothetical protein